MILKMIPFHIGGVQDLMRLVRAEPPEELLIDFQQRGVFMALAQRLAGIGVVKDRRTFALEILEVAHAGRLDRLSAAVDAPPGQAMISMNW